MARTWRKSYTKSKALDRSCRNHGACSWCESNRTVANTVAREIVDEKISDYFDSVSA